MSLSTVRKSMGSLLIVWSVWKAVTPPYLGADLRLDNGWELSFLAVDFLDFGDFYFGDFCLGDFFFGDFLALIGDSGFEKT